MNACPTCGMAGNTPCVRGSMHSPIWEQQIPYPEGHDSRRTINKPLVPTTPLHEAFKKVNEAYAELNIKILAFLDAVNKENKNE